MKKKWEVRYFVTAVASVPMYKAYSKTETYRQAAKDGWGTVYRDENNVLVCDEDCAADLLNAIQALSQLSYTPYLNFST